MLVTQISPGGKSYKEEIRALTLFQICSDEMNADTIAEETSTLTNQSRPPGWENTKWLYSWRRNSVEGAASRYSQEATTWQHRHWLYNSETARSSKLDLPWSRRGC